MSSKRAAASSAAEQTFTFNAGPETSGSNGHVTALSETLNLIERDLEFYALRTTDLSSKRIFTISFPKHREADLR